MKVVAVVASVALAAFVEEPGLVTPEPYPRPTRFACWDRADRAAAAWRWRELWDGNWSAAAGGLEALSAVARGNAKAGAGLNVRMRVVCRATDVYVVGGRGRAYGRAYVRRSL
jgi:hypothetical protein